MKFEYHVETVSLSVPESDETGTYFKDELSTKSLQNVLTSFAKEGWRLINTTNQSIDETSIVLIFERPIQFLNIISEIKNHVLDATKMLNLSKSETDLLEAAIEAGYEHSKDLDATRI